MEQPRNISANRKSPYYSVRTGKNDQSAAIDLPTLLGMFKTLFLQFEGEGYFQKSLGYECVDDGFVPGELGYDLQGTVLLELRKTGLTPIHRQIEQYSEDDLFDMIEFLHDHCAKPTKRYYHSFNNCGWHCQEFDIGAGRTEFREKVNKVLAIYSDGFELSSDGEVLSLAETGLEGLFEAPLPTLDPSNVEQRIDAARRKFRRHRSSLEDRRDAIRELADVLEYLRPQLKQVLQPKDESDLFNLANNFGIRHHNPSQKTAYDKGIWYSWMFYYYLATLHAALRLIVRANTTTKEQLESL
ncbi:hypothetical protein VB712_02740 [Spirulina sp. CCNP1310]|uniref:hypothetical protein n=1 Tax=Spirulina sp. CCNP1310 TaxID=3110249 RepID=UPI002B1FA7FD|nr:hypothetical protein [Spirulina sp. CCNP1310]MEA5418124.1 hypothetical protein [Spirulina sp. CCNP1310]